MKSGGTRERWGNDVWGKRYSRGNGVSKERWSGETVTRGENDGERGNDRAGERWGTRNFCLRPP